MWHLFVPGQLPVAAGEVVIFVVGVAVPVGLIMPVVIFVMSLWLVW
jgi:hypothetical protein